MPSGTPHRFSICTDRGHGGAVIPPVRLRSLRMCPTRRPGSHAPPLFTGTLAALANVLPHATRVELPGLNHVAAQDQGGKPAVIADQLRRFFGTETEPRH